MNQPHTKTNGPHPPRTRGTFHRRPKRLYTEKHTGFAPASSPKQSPCNIHTAITMRFAATSIHPCSRYNAIWNHRFQITQALRTHDETSIAKHHITHQNERTAPPRTRGTCHRRLKPLHTENTRFRAPASSPPFMHVLVRDVKSHTALHECMVMWCSSHRPSWMYCDVQSHTALHECIVMWCTVSHRLSWMYCYVM